MYLQKEIVDSIPIASDKVSQPGYLGSCIRKLKEKDISLVERSIDEPEFFVHRLKQVVRHSEIDASQPTLF